MAPTPVVVLGTGVAPDGTYVVVGVPAVPGAVVVDGLVVVGTPAWAGVVVAGATVWVGVVVAGTGGLVVAPEAEGLAVVVGTFVVAEGLVVEGCTLADAGSGKVGVELVFAAICL